MSAMHQKSSKLLSKAAEIPGNKKQNNTKLEYTFVVFFVFCFFLFQRNKGAHQLEGRPRIQRQRWKNNGWFHLNKLYADVWYFQQRYLSTWPPLCDGVEVTRNPDWLPCKVSMNVILGH